MDAVNIFMKENEKTAPVLQSRDQFISNLQRKSTPQITEETDDLVEDPIDESGNIRKKFSKKIVRRKRV